MGVMDGIKELQRAAAVNVIQRIQEAYRPKKPKPIQLVFDKNTGELKRKVPDDRIIIP